MQLAEDAGFGRFTLALRLFDLEGLGVFVGDGFCLISPRPLRCRIDRRGPLDIFRRAGRLWRFDSLGRLDSFGLLGGRRRSLCEQGHADIWR
jgi:hypothetical protein